MIYEQTPNGTNMLFLYRTEMPENQIQIGILFAALDAFCVWGGANNSNEKYISWEFDTCITEQVIRQALQRVGCYI